MAKRIDLSKFTPCEKIPDMHLFLTVKSFDLQAIRKRYIASKGGNKIGSVERRKVGEGGIAYIHIENGKIVEQEVLKNLKEPRGIAWSQDLFSVAAEDTIYLFQGRQPQILKNPWFSYIHTVDFSPDQESLLISSSGLDMLMEYSLGSLEKQWEWLAWENGFPTGLGEDGSTETVLTRHKDVADKCKKEGKPVNFISNPAKQNLPTAQRAAFINSVLYDQEDPEFLFATFFHEGAVYRIEKSTGKVEKVVEGLKNPHGGRNFHNKILATSTGKGEIHIKGQKGLSIYKTSNLPGKDKALGDMEWLQNTAFMGSYLITIDSNRTSFHIIQPDQEHIAHLPYDENWAVQDMVLVPEEKVQRLKELVRSI